MIRNDLGGVSLAASSAPSQPAVIPSQDTLIGDLLSMDLNVPPTTYNAGSTSSPSVDLLASGIDSLVSQIVGFTYFFCRRLHY